MCECSQSRAQGHFRVSPLGTWVTLVSDRVLPPLRSHFRANTPLLTWTRQGCPPQCRDLSGMTGLSPSIREENDSETQCLISEGKPHG